MEQGNGSRAMRVGQWSSSPGIKYGCFCQLPASIPVSCTSSECSFLHPSDRYYPQSYGTQLKSSVRSADVGGLPPLVRRSCMWQVAASLLQPTDTLTCLLPVPDKSPLSQSIYSRNVTHFVVRNMAFALLCNNFSLYSFSWLCQTVKEYYSLMKWP